MKIASVFLVLITLVSGCNKGKLLEEFTLTSEQRSQIPFNGFERISFIGNNDSVFYLDGGDRINVITKSEECITCNDYYLSETDYINFVNQNCELRLIMTASYSYRLTISCIIDDNAFTGIFYNNLPLSKEKLSGKEVFLDSLYVNSVMYYNVFGDTLEKNEGIITIDSYPTFFFYSTEYGVLKVNFSDGSSWDLDQIIM